MSGFTTEPANGNPFNFSWQQTMIRVGQDAGLV
jgi:hypothetical protein